MSPQGVPSPRRLVAAVGAVSDPRTWSGIPYHFFQTANRRGLVDEALDLPVAGPSIDLRRTAWNLGRVLSGGGSGGFQYSDRFLETLWKAELPRIPGSRILNCYQLYPSSITRDPSVEKWFFIDQTLTQLFDYYEQRGLIGHRIAREAIQRETDGYRAAAGVIMHSEWARESLVLDYGVDQDRTHVVVPGPSLAADVIEGLEPKQDREPLSEHHPLSLVFVGKEWRRKGLDRLLRAVRLTREHGHPITLTVVGCDRRALPAEVQGVEGVEWLGYIDKREQEMEFVRILRRADIGCLLSRNEAGGIALREFHSLGLPVLGPDTGGAPEHMISKASVAVAPTADDDEVAETLTRLCVDDELARLSHAAWDQRDEASWDTAVASLGSFWPPMDR